MNDLDNEIRRAFDELVNAAPPPPTASSSTVRFVTDRAPRNTRILAVAASVLLVAAVGIIVFAQRNGGTQTLTTSDEPDASQVATTQPREQSAPNTIRVETGGSPEPVTSVERPPGGEYEVTVAPLFPGTTEPVPAPGQDYNGVYFAYLHEGVGPDDPLQLRFDVLQAFSGDDCATRFGGDSPGVCTPFGTDVNAVVGQLDLAVTEVPISVRDISSEASYRISGTELLALVNGATLSPSAPDSFLFSGGFGFLLTFESGTLTRIDQPGAEQPDSTAVGWTIATAPFPSLSYLACCGIDWAGPASPDVPIDPADELAPGIYNIRQVEADEPLDGVLTLEVRSYVRCNELGARGDCLGDGPYVDSDLGVADRPDRVVDLALDETVGVAVSGFACTADQALSDDQFGRGSDLAVLYTELADSYRTSVIEPLAEGVSASDIERSFTARKGVGFFDPGCPTSSPFAWAPSAGPAVRTPFIADVDSSIDPLSVNIWQTIILTALEVDQQGGMTLYVTAGLTS